VIATLLWIIAGGLLHGNFAQPVREMANMPAVSSLFFVALGHASVKTIYSYLGYYNVCHLGAEIKDPAKTIPRSMFLSVAGIALLYLAMNISVVSVIPWQEARHSEYIVSSFVEKLYGNRAGPVCNRDDPVGGFCFPVCCDAGVFPGALCRRPKG
jgi:amino acid transporter